jgi:RNA polymerase sigma-70 factor (ECF subfamily)
MSASGTFLPQATPLDPRHAGDHIDRLYRAAWALCGSREDAEDLVQETYARVLAKPRMLRSDDDLGYLLRALRNTFLIRKRTEQRRPRTEPFAEGFEPTGGSSPEAQLETREVFSAIAALPPNFRDVLVAVDVAGLSYDEAARALRIAKGTVMSRLYRARQQVARSLTDSSA